MTETRGPQGELRVVARLSGRTLDDVYRLFRMPEAPTPVDHVACVPVYDLNEAIAWLEPPAQRGGDMSEPRPPIAPELVTVPPPAGEV